VRRVPLLACAVLLLAACSTSSGSGSGGGDAAGPQQTCPASVTAKPGETTETIMVGGMARTYILHVPPGYTGKTPMPLVFDFHPITVPAQLWKGIAGWGTAADKDGFIVVWPQGYMNSWNVGRCCDPALSAHVDDVAFTRAIIEHVSSEACVDQKRIYASGCSNGGGMSYRLACDAADVIAAVAPVDFDCLTGPTNDPSCGECNPSRPITECQFRGTADMFCPYDGGPTSVVAGILFPGAEKNFATWAGIDQCTGSPQPLPSQNGCETYTACAGGAQTTLCTVTNGTHCGSYGTFPIVDTAWSMFQSHPLP
jgi:polyhydroxybutyrate depolymerase